MKHFSQCIYLSTTHTFLLLLFGHFSVIFAWESNDLETIKKWANALGNDLATYLDQQLCHDQIQENFQKYGAISVKTDIKEILTNTKSKLEAMFDRKRTLALNVAKKAEELSVRHVFDSNLKFDFPDAKRLYSDNMKLSSSSIPPKKPVFDNPKEEEEFRKTWEDPRYSPVHVEADPQFNDIPVNHKTSVVHVPTNVYYGLNHTKNSIKWSSGLDKVFMSNRDYDPDSYWQFFCSNDGFLRIYPLHYWRYPDFFVKTAPQPQSNQPSRPLDFYDCRLTQWFIKGAASPKDMVILVDTSGSMKGQRQSLAREVVLNLLDTLTDDDYVSMYNFSSTIEPMVECFGNYLVPANKQNIEKLKSAVRELRVANQSEMVMALQHAYDILLNKNGDQIGSSCNKIIVMITDGAVEDLQADILRMDPDRRVRIFTYLVGKEVTEIAKTRNMACNNRGRFAQIKDFTEIREHVQEYITVLSRPMVLEQAKLPIEKRIYSYTSVYADVTEIGLASWVWDSLEKGHIREAYKRRLDRLETAKNGNRPSSGDATNSNDKGGGNGNSGGVSAGRDVNDDATELEEKDYENEMEKKIESERAAVPLGRGTRDAEEDDQQGYRDQSQLKREVRHKIPQDMMVTIAVPVLNKTKGSILGVAGVDISMKEIAKLIPFYMIGVNGYSFMVNNNGHIIYHPDLRPLFQDFLKPYYTSVDLLELELVDNKKEARGFSPELQDIRRKMIEGQSPDCRSLKIKMHIDEQNRAITRLNKYCWIHIENTPFSLAVVVPETYGLTSVKGQIDATSSMDFSEFFRVTNWAVHPNWTYCFANPRHSKFNMSMKSMQGEDIMKTFLKLWRSDGEKSIDWTGSLTTNAGGIASKKLLFCDRQLIERLLFDAKATDIDLQKCKATKSILLSENQFRLPLKLVATRSGLTRFHQTLTENDVTDSPTSFVPKKSVDEMFYRRSVEFQARMKDPSYVFSVPFDSPENLQANTFVSASKALFLTSKSSKSLETPIASFLVKFGYQNFAEIFLNHPSICPSGSRKNCQIDCKSDQTDCLLVDNNGFIIAIDQDFESSDGFVHHVGLFLGNYNHDLFEDLAGNLRAYSKIRIFDYQAVCIAEGEKRSFSYSFLNPFQALKKMLLWFFAKISIFLLKIYLGCDLGGHNIVDSVYLNPSDYDYDYIERQENLEYSNNSVGNLIAPTRTFFYPCDKRFDLYEAQNWRQFEEPTSGQYALSSDGCEEHYVVQRVPKTNLLLIVVDRGSCSSYRTKRRIEHEEIKYESNNECDKENHHRNFDRRRPKGCFSFHKKEFNMSLMDCGKGVYLQPQLFIILLISFVNLVKFLQ